MAKHTAGPWQWSPYYRTEDGRETWTLLGENGYGILACDGEGNSPQGIGDEANACLIAAAPELLEALELALPKLAHKASCHSVRPASEWPEHGSASFGNCDCAITTVRAAIAKATGAAP